MEMFLLATVTALLTAMVVGRAQKRRIFLCQQEFTEKPR
jgi:hypothetical protein